MATSRKIVSFLDTLDEVGTTIDYVVGYMHDMNRDQPGYFRLLKPDEVAEAEKVRKFISSLLKSKHQPVTEFTDEMVQRLSEIVGDDFLDECLTRLELLGIPGTVKRWKKLRTLQVIQLPGEKVTDYLRQATTCYVRGLPTAGVILCRTILEFTLKEAVPSVGGISLQEVDKQDLLFKLIKLAGKAKILPSALVTKAHQIREAGNRAAHTGACSESAALATIMNSWEVLSHIYRPSRR